MEFDFSPDGTLLFVIFSGNTDIIICYQLANPYDVTTTFAELGGSGNNRENITTIDTILWVLIVRETPSGVSIFWCVTITRRYIPSRSPRILTLDRVRVSGYYK